MMKKKGWVLGLVIVTGEVFFMRMKGKEIEQLKKNEQKYLGIYRMLYQWINAKQDQKKLEDFFGERKFYKIAVYGMADLGRLFLRELKESDAVKIIYGIDRNAEAIGSSVSVIRPEDVKNEADVIVVTVLDAFESIKSELTKYTDAEIISIEDIVYNL